MTSLISNCCPLTLIFNEKQNLKKNHKIHKGTLLVVYKKCGKDYIELRVDNDVIFFLPKQFLIKR